VTHVLDQATTEVARKLDAVRSWVYERGLKGVVMHSQAGFAWITAGRHSHVSIGGAAGVATVLVTPSHAYLLTPTIERDRLLDEEVGELGFEVVEFPWYRPLTVDGLSDPSRTVADVEGLGLPVEAGLAQLRHTLIPEEIRRYRRLGIDAAGAVEAACRETRPGDTELSVAARVAAHSTAQDILPLVNLVAADERIDRYRHPLPTPKPVQRRLMVALTGRRHGLHASLTRMMSFGPLDAEIAERHAAVRRVDARMLGESRLGTTLGTVLDAAVEQYDAEGFPGEWEHHHQGGLTGYAGREIFATPRQPHRLDAGQALAWNPSITGVKSEDTVLVTPEGQPEVLTRTPGWPREGPEGLERPLILKGAT
jgi:Xaa-Pro dipeptidase